jgi:hypothetical protein
MQTLVIETEGKKFDALLAVLKALDISFVQHESQAGYSQDFAKKIEKAKKNYKNGEYITIKDTNNIWESILSE